MVPDVTGEIESHEQWLAAADEALRSGRTLDDAPTLPMIGSAASSQLRQSVACLERLERLWPRAGRKPELLIPARIGRFEIQRVLGRGGFGIVLLARDPLLRRTVALKLPRPEILGTQAQRARFLQEARAAGQLEHPQIVPVLEAGEIEGALYIASAYCSGGDLATWLREHPEQVNIRWAARIVATLADAVHEAHRWGIVHRDLKPGNVLLVPLGDTQGAGDAFPFQLKITDFGLAKIAEDQLAATGSNVLLGTPEYMSPEQAAGRGSDSTPQSDIYSLGAILYELLTRKHPHGEASGVQLLRRVVEEDPVPVTRVRHDVPRDLASVCMKCLEKSPGRRYPAAAELRDDLQRFLEGRPVTARPVSAAHRVVRWCRRRPVHAALLVVVVAAGVGAAAGTWIHVSELNYALEREKDLRGQTEQLKTVAEKNLATATARGAALRRQLFCLDARTGQRELEVGHGAEARALLARYADDPSIASTFTWRYLTRLCHLEERTWNLGSQVYWVEFSPDGRRLIAGVEAGYAVMWNVETGDELFRLQGHTSCVNAVRFTSDGGRLWTASCDGTIRQWDAAGGGQIEVFANRGVKIETLAISPDGSRIAAGEHREQAIDGIPDSSGSVVLWDVEQRRLLGEQTVSELRLESLDFSDDGERLAAASGTAATVFDVRTGLTPLSHEEESRIGITGAVFLPQGRTIAWTQEHSDDTSWISIQDSDSATETQRIPCADPVTTVAIDAAGGLVFVGTNGGCIEAREMTADRRFGRLRQTLWGHAGRVCCLAVSPDGRRLASAGFDGTVRLWPIRDTEDCRRLVAEHGTVAVSFAAGGDTLLSVAIGLGVRSYNVADWKLRFEVHGSAIATSADPRDSRFIACAYGNGSVYAADTVSGRYLANVRLRDAFNPDLHLGLRAADDRFYVAWQPPDQHPTTDQSYVEEWSFDPPGLLRRLATHSGFIRDMAVSEASIALVKDGIHPDIEVIDLASGTARTFSGNYPFTRALAFSPDGTLLAAACDDCAVRLWHVASGELVMLLTGHEDVPQCLAFTADGRELSSGDFSGKVRIWNLETGTESLVLHAHPEPVRAVAFSPDGWSLVTSSSNYDVKDSENAQAEPAGEVRVWSAR